jgi:hypothetical protein
MARLVRMAKRTDCCLGWGMSLAGPKVRLRAFSGHDFFLVAPLTSLRGIIVDAVDHVHNVTLEGDLKWRGWGWAIWETIEGKALTHGEWRARG